MPKCIKCEVAEVLPDQIYCSECQAIKNKKESNLWFNRHLNITLFAIWLIFNLIVAIPQIIMINNPDGDISGIWVVVIITLGVLMLLAEVWYLSRKNRSFCFLFFNLLNIIGFIIILGLKNKASKKIVAEPETQQV